MYDAVHSGDVHHIPTLQAGLIAVQQHPDLADGEGSHHTLEQTLLWHPQNCPGEVRADLACVPSPTQVDD